MTVKKLIEELQKHDVDKPVKIRCTYDEGEAHAGGSKIEIIEKQSCVELFNDEC